jgi:hypothetical protein
MFIKMMNTFVNMTNLRSSSWRWGWRTYICNFDEVYRQNKCSKMSICPLWSESSSVVVVLIEIVDIPLLQRATLLQMRNLSREKNDNPEQPFDAKQNKR